MEMLKRFIDTQSKKMSTFRENFPFFFGERALRLYFQFPSGGPPPSSRNYFYFPTSPVIYFLWVFTNDLADMAEMVGQWGKEHKSKIHFLGDVNERVIKYPE